MRSRLSAFLRDRSGAIAPLVAVALIALVGVGGLAWDVSRAYALRGELDSAVDASALAGATQLDGQTGAMSRARTAAKGALVQNAQRLGRTRENDVTIADADITFLQDLTTRTQATSDANASFIQINLTPRQMGPVTGALVRVSAFNATAHAVAGYGSALCLVPPLMICNPNESSSLSFDGDLYTGKAFILTPPPNGNGAWAPGNFGFLRVGNGASAIKDAMGRNPPQTECFGSTVVTEAGNISSADDWFNTRFDIYRSSAAGESNDPLFAPSLNTMVGSKANANGNASCNPSISTPPNDCSGTSAVASGYGFPIDCGMVPADRVGSGTWNVGRYFNSNHDGIDSTTYVPTAPASPAFPGSGWAAYGPTAVAGATTPTRYQIYNWELAILSGAISKPAQAFSDGQDASPPSGNKDFARPTCNQTNPVQASPDRRTISAVVVNCSAEGIHGQSTVHVIANVDLFLIAPADSAAIYGEFIRATPATQGSVAQATRRFWVRLYE